MSARTKGKCFSYVRPRYACLCIPFQDSYGCGIFAKILNMGRSEASSCLPDHVSGVWWNVPEEFPMDWIIQGVCTHVHLSQDTCSCGLLQFYQFIGFSYWNCFSVSNCSDNTIHHMLSVSCESVTVLNPLRDDIKNIDFFLDMTVFYLARWLIQ